MKFFDKIFLTSEEQEIKDFIYNFEESYMYACQILSERPSIKFRHDMHKDFSLVQGRLSLLSYETINKMFYPTKNDTVIFNSKHFYDLIEDLDGIILAGGLFCGTNDRYFDREINEAYERYINDLYEIYRQL